MVLVFLFESNMLFSILIWLNEAKKKTLWDELKNISRSFHWSINSSPFLHHDVKSKWNEAYGIIMIEKSMKWKEILKREA